MQDIKIMVAMSGGVDSSVAALLLQQQGYTIAGATFLLYGDGTQAVQDAKKVCSHLGIPHYVFDYSSPFREHVVDPFLEEYRAGRTPNPCVYCNRHIKYGAFLEDARSMGYDSIATGHYVRFESPPYPGRARIRKAVSLKKDQSYFLYPLKQQEIRSFHSPLAELDKPQVRQIALEHKLPVATKTDSQDICFIPGGDLAGFFEDAGGMDCPQGDFVDMEGTAIGRHKGICHYTIGQRKGLGAGFGKPVYVQDIDAASNTVVLGPDESLYKTKLVASNLNWIDIDSLDTPMAVQAKIRYAHTPAPATLYPLPGGKVEAVFESPQRAVTAGQSVVFYDGEYLVGGGTIEQHGG